MAETIARRLARFVEDCDLACIPKPVVERAKLYVMDTLAAALTGASVKSSRIVARVARSLGGRRQCTVVGHRFRTSPALAALANGAIGHAVEIDDDHRTSVLHPGVAVVPAALATAEQVGAGGRALLEGVIAGYDVMTRIGDAFLGTQYHEGFHPTGTCGVFGAAAAAGRVLGLKGEPLVAALGIAGTQAAGLEEWKADGSWIKRLHPGKAAEAGVLAALLAKGGYTGPDSIVEGQHGFLKAFSFERKWDADLITRGLGGEWRGAGTSFKPYACCRFSHQLVDAVLEAVRAQDFAAGDIEEATVRIYRTAYETLFTPPASRYRPKTVVDAQFSIPYAVAVAVLHGRPLPHHFTERMIRNRAVLDLAARVRGIPDDDYEKQYPQRYPTKITFRLKDGREVAGFNDLPSGDPSNPVYAREPGRFERDMVDKFRALLASLPAYAGRTDDILGVVRELDALPDARRLARLFAP
jgi:2-methylcitrate dehydratase PrpD